MPQVSIPITRGGAFLGLMTLPAPTGMALRSAQASPAAQSIAFSASAIRSMHNWTTNANGTVNPPKDFNFGMGQVLNNHAENTGAGIAASQGDGAAMAALAGAQGAVTYPAGPVQAEIANENGEGVTQVTRDQVRAFYLHYYSQVATHMGVNV